MKTALKLNQQIQIKSEIYSIIGIDHYQLINILGGKKEWKSYTLIDKQKNKTWISYESTFDSFIQWEEIDEQTFIEHALAPIILDRSGIVNITFEGNQGYSTPNAELMLFRVKDKTYDFVGVERFIEEKDNKITPMKAYYQTGKILKNFTL